MGGRVHHVGGGGPGEEAPLGLLWLMRTISHQFSGDYHTQAPTDTAVEGGDGEKGLLRTTRLLFHLVASVNP